ncbi:unannotated protein [freshwater metagenome]|uniref:Unannotated protein n=1 Tax=freshwater metagenome TaxID=449393 RepID=A0A6J7P0D5_9ZZZZ|nr:hypothetical protein [Actinomycetota bacterium]
MPPRTPKPAWSNLESRLQEIEQGDLISFGAVGIVTRKGAAFAASAGLEGDGAGVVALTVETAAGWYAVLSQDCDIVRGVDAEPTLTVAPVMFIPHNDWQRLHLGQTSFRQFALTPEAVSPIDEEHAVRIPDGHAPVVDIRYVSTVDKTALEGGFERRAPLVGDNKREFQVWVGQRFGRESFADAVHETVLPSARRVLDAALKARQAGDTSPMSVTVATVSEYWVRATDRYVEVLGRLEPTRGRAAGMLVTAAGVSTWNERALDEGCRKLSQASARLMRQAGYTVKFTVKDFAELSAAEAETYTLWRVQDDPPPP